ncbi:MAG: tetratricopeptide repeat protein [Vampirovibrionia bacterium]
MNKLVKKVLLLCLIVAFLPVYAFAENELYKAGVVSYNQGKYEQALKFLSDAVKEAPQDVRALYYFANTLVKTHNFDYAKKYYERVIQLSPMSDYASYSQVALNDLAMKDASIEQPVDSLYVNDSQLFNSNNS